MRVIFNDFKKTYKANKRAINSSIKRVLGSGRFILGEEVTSFEKEFAAYNESHFAIGVANGLEAIQIVLLALGIGKGDEVITTSHSAVATTLAIKSVGATPVFVDTDEFFHIDPKLIEKKINKKTRAIIPVHLYGQSAEIDKITAIAKKRGVYVIEDCAQAHGAEYKNKKVGNFGMAGCFSFYPTKNLGAFGDGGMITTQNKSLAEKCMMIRNYGQKNRYEHLVYGLNSRLDEIQAAILRALLKNLDKSNERRKNIASIYRKELASLSQIKLPIERKSAKHVYHLFVIETKQREALQKYLKENGIDTLIHYPIPIHKQKCFPEFNKIKLPNTESRSEKILSIPCHPFMEKDEALYVSEKIKSFFKNEK